AFRPPAAFCHISTQETASFTGWIRRIEQSFFFYSILKHLIDNTRLHCRLQIAFIDGDDLIEFLHGQADPSMNRQCAATESGTRTTRCYRNEMLVSKFENCRDL